MMDQDFLCNYQLKILFRLNFYNKGQAFFFVKNCLQGIELTQANLSARDLLEGCWENITESNPCVLEPGKEVPTLTICLWGRTVSLSAPLSQYRVHSSSSLWTNRISSLIQSRGPDVACCLNTGLTESHKSCGLVMHFFSLTKEASTFSIFKDHLKI